MNYRLVLSLLLVASFLIYVVHADSSAGFGGIRAREEEKFDPYGRIKYFGESYTKPVFGYGRKDAPSAKTVGNYGRKGAGGVRNKLYNDLISQGRNPAKISNYDSSWKGSKNMDVTVDLRPLFELNRDKKTLYSNGFARIMSQEYSQTAGLPFSEIHVSVLNAPPSNKTEIMGVWLVDDVSGYPLHIGNFFVNAQGSGSLSYRVYNYFGAYTTLLLTREPLYSTDPFPHEPIFVGDIKR